MNAFILWLFLVLIGTILCGFAMNKWPHNPFPFIGTLVGAFCSLVMIVTSFTVEYSNRIEETSHYRTEVTPYRVVLTAFDKEATFTDAFTVVNAPKINGAQKNIPYNAWGIEMTSMVKITPTFAK